MGRILAKLQSLQKKANGDAPIQAENIQESSDSASKMLSIAAYLVVGFAIMAVALVVWKSSAVLDLRLQHQENQIKFLMQQLNDMRSRMDERFQKDETVTKDTQDKLSGIDSGLENKFSDLNRGVQAELDRISGEINARLDKLQASVSAASGGSATEANATNL